MLHCDENGRKHRDCSFNTHISNLPDEVLSSIFKHLNYSDRKIVSLVCKQWYQALLQDPELLDQERLLLKYDIVEGYDESRYIQGLLQCVQLSNRKYRHISIQGNLNSEFTRMIGISLGAVVRSLSLNQWNVNGDLFFILPAHFPELRSLHICADPTAFSSNNPICVNLQRLHTCEKLKTMEINIFNSQFFETFLKIAPNLNTLSVSMDLKETEVHGYDSWKSLAEFARKYAHFNFELSVRTYSLSDIPDRGFVKYTALYELLEMANVHLRKIEVHALLSTSHTHLAHLEHHTFLDDRILSSLVDYIQDVKHLKLDSCPPVGRSAGKLHLFKKLTSLEMLMSWSLDDNSVSKGLCSTINTTLKHLTITGRNSVSPECIALLSKTHPALTHLNLTCCQSITDWSVQSIFHHQLMLETLILNQCENLTDSGLSGIKDQSTTEHAHSSGYPISRLKRLHTLDLASTGVKGILLGDGFKSLDIRNLSLSHTEIGFDAIEILCENNRSIETLNLSYCHSITDELLGRISTKLQRLKSIDVTGCCAVTPKGFAVFKTGILSSSNSTGFQDYPQWTYFPARWSHRSPVSRFMK